MACNKSPTSEGSESDDEDETPSNRIVEVNEKEDETTAAETLSNPAPEGLRGASVTPALHTTMADQRMIAVGTSASSRMKDTSIIKTGTADTNIDAP